MDKKDAFKQKFEAQLDAWRADIDKLKAKAKSARADAELDYSEFIEDLKKKQAALRNKLDQFEDAGEDAWKDLRGGIEQAFDDLKKAVQKAKKRFD
jgi:predicted  nucleic acid-binding Zn-ribbon protein